MFNFDQIWDEEFVYIGAYRKLIENIETKFGVRVVLRGVWLRDTIDGEVIPEIGNEWKKNWNADMAWVKEYVQEQDFKE